MNAIRIGYIIGFSAQVLFTARVLVQWIQSERIKKVFNPISFWILSLLGSFLMFIYGWLRNDFPIILGQSITYYIYIRNLQLQNAWTRFPRFFRILFFVFPFLIIPLTFINHQLDISYLFKKENISTYLLVWGILGQLVFTFRFIYQWIYSEKIKESTLPLGFWIISLLGSMMILSYAVLRKDIVLFLGQVFTFIVYIRNIVLIRKSQL